tara:strand:- start:1069 stop:2316 length:1248 start_codon:yes stop_codon:yes gene_type:complete
MSNTKEVAEVKISVPDGVVKQEGDFKMPKPKAKPKNLSNNTKQPVKVDFTKQEKDAIRIKETGGLDENKSTGDLVEMDQSIQEPSKDVENKEEKTIVEDKNSPIQLITDEESNIDESGVARSTETTNAASEQKEIQKEVETPKLPENIEKLVQFMEKTGGTIEDYTRLNADYSNINDDALLHEYYKTAKPHLNAEERGFMIEDSFHFDEELDEARDIRKKKLDYKEEVAKAKSYLEDLKDKYYAEIKLRPGVTQDQQKATDFFNRYTEDQKVSKVNHERFVTDTNNLLNDDFKGFDFNVGEQKFRYGVKDPQGIANQQSDISNFIKTFLNDKGEIKNTKGYHKALYAAQNADTIASHFYEQGKTDAIKSELVRSKNISTEPRKTVSGEVFIHGLKVKAMSGSDSSKLKLKKRTFN